MKDTSTTALRDVIRGSLHWRELRNFGVDVQHYGGVWTFGPPLTEPLHAAAADLHEGIRALLGEPAAITEWAQFILAAAGLIDLDALESDERGNQLLECLWDLSRGEMESAKQLLPSQR